MERPLPVSLAAVVLAAGKGTRMKSARAKVLHELCGRPLGALPIARAMEAGADPVVVVVGHQADAVRERLVPLFPEAGLRFALQTEQLGTGHAVLVALEYLSETVQDVLVVSGDVPRVTADTLRAVVAVRRARRAAVGLVSMRPPSPRGYGRLVLEADGTVARIVEEKDASDAERAIADVNAGLYCVERRFLANALRRLSPKNVQGEYYLTDIAGIARHDGLQVASVAADFAEVSGVNDRAELAEAEALLRRELNRAHMRAGVSMRDPATAWIDMDVEIGPDCEIGPNVTLRGRTKLGRGVRVGAGCVVEDSTLADGAVVHPLCHLEGARVGAGALVGPFARLRPGTELSEGVHIGNFVETKKTRIGRGSKANHLAYLGDATIGEKCNIGAGTITCNYDGFAKLPTVMGDGVFIGSDTQLVAPVRLGDGAYVGAGSTITKDVPPDTLAFTRPPLTMKEGWPSRRKAMAAAAAAEKAGRPPGEAGHGAASPARARPASGE